MPTIMQLVAAVRLVGASVGASEAIYCFEGRFAFQLDAGWWLVISPDSAQRFKIEACRGGRVLATMWCLAGDDARLAELASSAAKEAAALVA
jgi:hypothetical protein